MRVAAALVLLTAAACSPEPSGAARAQDGTPHAESNLVQCAPAGESAFARACAVERSREGEVLFLTVRHPDGGFRRFEVLSDGRGLAPADGAEPAQSRIVEGVLEVAVGSDRYRFPATVADHAGSR